MSNVAVDFHSSPTIVWLFLLKAKTDPFRTGVHIFLGKTNFPMCPVVALLSYLSRPPATGGPLLVWGNYALDSKELLVLEQDSAWVQFQVGSHHQYHQCLEQNQLTHRTCPSQVQSPLLQQQLVSAFEQCDNDVVCVYPYPFQQHMKQMKSSPLPFLIPKQQNYHDEPVLSLNHQLQELVDVLRNHSSVFVCSVFLEHSQQHLV